MKLFTHILSLIFICCVSCGRKQNIQSPEVSCETLKCLNCSPYDTDKDSLIYDDVKIVRLETNDSCLIHEIKQIEVKDSFIFILDIDRKLFVFDINGKFISQTGKYGHGPGEYLTINTFYIENNNIVIIDDVKSSLIRYDFKGEHLYTEKFPPEYFRMSCQAVLTEDNKLLLQHGINMEANMAYSLIDMNKNELTGQYFSYNPIKLDNHIYYYSNHPMSRSDRQVDFILPLCDTVFCYTESSFFPKYIVEIPGKMVSKHQIKNNTASYRQDIVNLGKQGFFTGFTAIFETEKHILLEYSEQGLILGYFLCSKTSKQGYYHLYATEEESYQIPFFRIIGSFDNTFIGVSQAYFLFGGEWKISGETGSQFNRMISSLQEEDNPVLFFYKLKEKI
jgi:hypothetical protein